MAISNDDDPEKFKKGVELVYAQLFSVLEKQGLKKIQTNGKFDPYKHEVLLTEKHEDKEDEEILEELQPGYVFHEQVIRTAKVKINKKW